MTLSRLSPSKSKKEFLEHMRLCEDNSQDRRVYRDMMDEAAAARERMCVFENLTPQAQSTPGLKPPFSSNMIMETAQYKAVCEIYALSSPTTREQYAKGNFQDGSQWDNWVIRWCLWHVFRYRDERNRNRSHRGSGYYPTNAGLQDVSHAPPQFLGGSDPTSPRTSMYDPIRELYR
ncbi:hypothetical protein BT63DRAFT_409343 [Microthyrium microscopicum]|uniref:Uncharacterized protein n=1 Tax=Microthyrium microscopicum TaxID=703497 RepID=A0A6A6UUY6_9PEZI|nr:hypothetical protein BT63DRAFT_409343 [Microthyrium microscopicum]